MPKKVLIISLKSILVAKSRAFARERLRMSKKSCTFVGCIVCQVRALTL